MLMRFCLPATRRRARASAAAATSSTITPQGVVCGVSASTMTLAAKPVVLLAGENNFVGLLAYIVEQEGFVSLLTDDPDEVTSLAEARRPHLITLDDFPPHGS